MSVDDSVHFLDTLVSALGISQRRPPLQRFTFRSDDSLGEEALKVSQEDGLKHDETAKQVFGRGSVQQFKISDECDDLAYQVQQLKTLEENVSALNRITSAAQILVARHVYLMLIAALSTQQQSGKLLATLRSLELTNVKSLVQILRLVDADRVNGTPGKCFLVSLPSGGHPLPALDCLNGAIGSAVTDEGLSTGLHLMQVCSRDLFTAAVGGVELVQQAGRKRHRRLAARLHSSSSGGEDEEDSDVSVLAKPNFKVSQRLVKILVKSAGKFIGNESLVGGLVQMMDALAACLFSSKLEAENRLWALRQLVKIFAATGAGEVMKKCALQTPKGD